MGGRKRVERECGGGEERERERESVNREGR